MPATNNLVEIQNMSFKRGKRIIFDNVNINIQRGKVTAILGPSGTGKTTLLRLIGAQLKPVHGKITVNDTDIHQLSRQALYAARRDIGMLFQSSALFTNLSAFENVAFPLREHTKLTEDMIRDLVLMKLQTVGLRGARDLFPSELSGGMARRVALARAIIMDPQLIMYDEPFAGLDPIALGVIAKLIRQLNDALNMTSILVSHDVNETTEIADYVYIIADGQVIGQGAPKQVLQDPNPQVQQFMRGLPDGVIPFAYPAKDYREDLLG